MMNLFQLQEQLKDFSKDQLLSEMQSPSGSAPPFLVMTELQRRSRMENAAALDQGPPTSTVAQDTVNAAGVPQGGIADMARSMAPQTNMTQNTGMMTPQAGVAPQGAAPVQPMQEGGLAGISRNVRDYGVDAYLGPDFMASGPDRSEQELMEATATLGLDLPGRLLQGQRGGGAADMNTFPRAPAALDVIDVSDTAFSPRTSPATTPPAPIDEFLSALPMGDLTEGLRPRTERVVDAAIDRRMGGDQPQSPTSGMTAEQREAFAALTPEEQQNVLLGGAPSLEDARTPMTGSSAFVGANDYQFPPALFEGPFMSPADAVRRYEAFESGAPYVGPVPARVQPGAPDTPPTLVPTEDLAGMAPEDLLPAPPAPEVLTPEAPTGPPGGGVTSGATVGGMPVPPPQSAEDRMLQQDKWLALARFGAALASSQAPTFGQALGQAGQVGLDALQQARQDFLERKAVADEMALRRGALAARGAGGGGAVAEAGPSIGITANQNRVLEDLDQRISQLQMVRGGLDEGGFLRGPDPQIREVEDAIMRLQTQRDLIANTLSGIGGLPQTAVESMDDVR